MDTRWVSRLRVYLHELPVEHELRNKHLTGAFYHHRDGKFSREIFATYGIAKKCYNDLGPSWTDADVFYFEVQNESDQERR